MNPMDLFKNIQKLQSKMGETQERLKSVTAIGTAGGDMVRVEIDGQFSVRSVTISPEVVDPNDVEMLQDLVLAAFTDASAKVRDKMKDEMASISGDLGIPPGMLGGGM